MRHTLLIPSACLCFLLACSSGPAPTPAPEAGYDVIIEGGKVVDGTGAAWFYGDVAVAGDRVVSVVPPGMLATAASRDRIDATGLVVAPGFIDIQSHSRPAFLSGDGRVISKVTQGITTEIMGEGTTNAPVNEKTLEAAGVLGTDGEDDARRFQGAHGFDGWLRAMADRGVSPNIGSFVGAGTLRVYGAGLREGPATRSEVEIMQEAVRLAMEDGAFGIATALIYPPGNFASTDELVALASAMAPYGGVYITHMRSEADQYLEAIDEAIEIGRRAGVPVEIYHLKAGGRRNWPKAAQAIAKIDSARAEGLDMQANMYPYVAGGTGLTACLPPSASADGQLFQNLEDPERRAAIKAEILDQQEEWENLCGLATPDGVLLLGLEKEENQQWRGKRLAEVAEALDKHWVDAAMDLILSERQRIGSIYFLMSEENVALQMRQPWIKFGTDAGGFDPERASGLTHPRAYGTYPRILGKYVREEGVLPLEDAVRKSSSAVATRLGIRDRGLIKPGMYADIVIFDAERISDRATFVEPHRLSVGVEHVLVNGVPVVRDGTHTGATPGRVVRGAGWCGWGGC